MNIILKRDFTNEYLMSTLLLVLWCYCFCTVLVLFQHFQCRTFTCCNQAFLQCGITTFSQVRDTSTSSNAGFSRRFCVVSLVLSPQAEVQEEEADFPASPEDQQCEDRKQDEEPSVQTGKRRQETPQREEEAEGGAQGFLHTHGAAAGGLQEEAGWVRTRGWMGSSTNSQFLSVCLGV